MAIETPIDPKLRSEPVLSPPSAARAETDEEISLLDGLVVLVERKLLIFWMTAGCAILSIVVSLLLPISYKARLTLFPPQQTPSLGAQLASQFGTLGGVAAAVTGGSSLSRNQNEMYVAMLRSRVVEEGVIQRFGLMQEYHKQRLSDARKRFENCTTVEGSGKDGLIHISVEDRDPRRAAELANGYVDQFRDLSQHLAITESGQRRLFFEQQLKLASQNLGDAEEALKETEQRTGLIQLDSQARALIESAVALRAQITAKEVQIQGMQTYATGENAQMIEAQQQLDSLRAQLAKLGGSSGRSDELIVPKGKMTEAGLEYARKLRDVKYYETIFDILARQFELAKLDEAKEGAIIQVIDPAVPPDKRSFPKRSLIVIAGTLAGFVLGILLASFQAKIQSLRDDPESRGKIDRITKALALKKSAMSSF